MELVQEKLPDLYDVLNNDIRDKNWEDIAFDLNKLNWLSSSNSLETFKGYIEIADIYGLRLLESGDKFSVIKTVQVASFVNTLVFRERNKGMIKDMVFFVEEYFKKFKFFRSAKEKLAILKGTDLEDKLNCVIEYYKDVHETLMVACMHISAKFEKIQKKDINSYIKALFFEDLLQPIKCSNTSNRNIQTIISNNDPRPSYNRNYNTITKLSSNLYFGEINEANSLRDGYGRLSLENGDKYEGYWRNGVMNGQGVYIWKKKAWYKGDFLNGAIHGKGVKKFPDGGVYEGGFNLGKMHGFGKMTFANGDAYEGNWASDLMSGFGKYYWNKCGDTFEGSFRNDARETGVLKLHTGEELKM